MPQNMVSPYFDQRRVHGLIQTMARQDSLVIYIGAGASIDRTGLSWENLIDRLLANHLDGVDARKLVMGTHRPMEAASVVLEHYVRANSERALESIRDQVKSLLYTLQGWQRGSLITAIVLLAAKLTALGRRVHVVTTNFDNYLEKELEVANLAQLGVGGASGLALQPLVVEHLRHRPGDNLEEHARRYLDPGSIVYLHGRVPDSSSDAGDASYTQLVLGESDYIDSQPLSAAILEQLFRENSVIVVGSSMADPPLLHALAKTAEATRAGRTRVAVLPLQGISLSGFANGDTDHAIKVYSDNAGLRFKRFGLTATFPHYYYQVPQFLTEVQVALDHCAYPQSPYPQSGKRYGNRLVDWGREWKSRREGSADEPFSRHQAEDHRSLRFVLDRIRGTLDAGEETMKLEIWLRWEFERRRALHLWASSTGTWPDFDSMRSAPIAADSKYASVKSFCVGRPQIYDTEDASDRWLTYLSVPIRYKLGEGDLPVAVVSLASMSRTVERKTEEFPPVSRIGLWNGTVLGAVVADMTAVGEAMVDLDPVGTDEIMARFA